MAAQQNILELMMDRPGEPLFWPKGEERVAFDVDKEYLPDKYKNRSVGLANRASFRTETLPKIATPNISKALELGRDENFSLFVPKHQEVARSLIDLFLKVPNGELNTLIATVAAVRDKVNTQLFNYALSVALLHRQDTRNVKLPNFMETFPAKFADSRFLQESREVAFLVTDPNQRQPIIIPKDYSASDLDEEHRVAYFREDIGVNLHHWHWHLVYPFTSADRSIVAKDRRGELFYYMHQQVLARYNADRMCNMLPRTKRFNNFREPITEGYFPKLDSLTAGRGWPSRQAGIAWSNLNRQVDNMTLTIDTMELWRARIDEAISSGRYLLPNGQTQPLTIDILGNMVESTDLSPNPDYYGTLHNGGHLFTAYIHDPEHRYLERMAVLADPGTALRDPFFYRWHAMIDNIFQKFKSSTTLNPPYTRAQLINPNITVESIAITGTAGRNVLNTFWMESDVDMSRGLDFSDRSPVLIRFTHLNHRPFSYTINVNNTGEAKMGTVRIFMAPKNDERGLPLQLNEQRLLFIEMDRFVQQLPRGKSVITRNSTQSSITIPFERTFRDLRAATTGTSEQLSMSNMCGCGWPQHMLVPKGTVQGAPFQLFVMISNYFQDRVNQNVDNVPCQEASSFCGIKDSLYPDMRAMGYPFDRPPNQQLNRIEDLIQTNMKLQDVTIRFTNVTEQNPRNPKRT